MTVIPPKEIKDVIEKTANFIAKMGLETQERIRRDEAENPRFAFLKANDQYHAYYREKLKELGITIDTEYVKDVIYPPVELRLIIDKTAGFVVKNGAEFQERIRENEKGNPRFSFLNPMDPYHLYYTYKLQEISEGRVLLKPIEEDVLVQKNNKATNKQNAAPPEPEKFQFYFEHPPVSAIDLDVIKLTALFVARNGRQFMTMVSQREAKNFQFDFLKPHHSLFPFFNALSEQYTKVLIPSKDMKDKLEKDANDKFNALDRIMGRLEYELYTEEQRKMEEEQRAREEEMYNQIDWNDFVIVQTIDFKEMDLHVDLPGPIDQATMKSLTMLQKKTVNETFPVANQENYQEEDEDMDMDMDMDDEEEAPVEGPKVIVPETMASVKIKTNYIPKAELLKHAKPSDQLQLCPVCNQMILSSELQEHMRIELLDPKWKEQRDRMLAKQGSTNYVQEGYDIGKHMEDFAKKRSDIFGKGEQPQGKEKINENVVQWDGHAASKSIAKEMAKNVQPEASTPISTIGPAPQAFLIPTTPKSSNPTISTFSSKIPLPPMPKAKAPIPEPPEKKLKADEPQKPKDEKSLIALYPNVVKLTVQCPNVPEKPDWNLKGQSLPIMLNLKDSIQRLKESIFAKLNFPISKQKITVPGFSNLKNEQSLASYLISPDVKISLSIKERGGR